MSEHQQHIPSALANSGVYTAALLQQLLEQAVAAHQQGRLLQAQALYQQVLERQADNFDALHLSGVIAAQNGDAGQAVQLIGQAITINPHQADAHYNYGNALQNLKQYLPALTSYEQAISLQPDYADAYLVRGYALQQLRRYDAALESFRRVIQLRPNDAEPYHACGLTLNKQMDYAAALTYFSQALALQAGYVEAHNGYGYALNELKRYDEALLSFSQAATLQPDSDFLAGQIIQAKLQICDWQGINDQVAELGRKIADRKKAVTPFTVLACTDDPVLQRQAAEIWTQEKYPPVNILGELVLYPHHEKIRIGYFSPDFRSHAVAFLTAELFELHNRDQFEIIAFSLGADNHDPMRTRLEAGFDHFLHVQNLSDQEIAQIARNLQLDIAVDLTGHTARCRPGIFALRAAPVQVSYIGYLGTMGAGYIDYLLADRVVIPPQAKTHYLEKIAYLPSYQVNDSRRSIADISYSRTELGLPTQGFVFCCFNNNYKLSPETFGLWMNILKLVPDSVLFLLADNPIAASNLQQAALAHGVAAERLIFGKPLPLPEYLARYRLADLFLDTNPYNAGATASDALWAGLPVLTRAGESFAGRVAASLLTAIGLPELITNSPQAYQALAVELATQPERLASIKTKLAANRLTTPLFDSQGFTSHLEAAYRQMYARFQAGLPPEHIDVSA